MTRFLPLALLLLLLASCQQSPTKTIENETSKEEPSRLQGLQKKLAQIVEGKKAKVGFSFIGNHGKDSLSINGNGHFSMQSVFKMHISLLVLSHVDKGLLRLDQNIDIKKSELTPGIWSPLREENPNGGSFSIARLIQYSIVQSDNISCDVLLKLVGGPSALQEHFRKLIGPDISVAFNEKDMQSTWENMFQNWTSPIAASQTLLAFYENKNNLLSKSSYDFFWKTMKETVTGKDRLKGLLPAATVVAHKTGTSGTNKEGLTAATNDIGLVFLPNGNYFVISVFVADSKESEETNARIIAELSKACYDFYSSATN